MLRQERKYPRVTLAVRHLFEAHLICSVLAHREGSNQRVIVVEAVKDSFCEDCCLPRYSRLERPWNQVVRLVTSESLNTMKFSGFKLVSFSESRYKCEFHEIISSVGSFIKFIARIKSLSEAFFTSLVVIRVVAGSFIILNLFVNYEIDFYIWTLFRL